MGSYYCKMYIGNRHQRTFGGTKGTVHHILRDYVNDPTYILNDTSNKTCASVPDYIVVKAKFYCYKKNRSGSKKLRKTILIEYLIKNMDGKRNVLSTSVYEYQNKQAVISGRDT